MKVGARVLMFSTPAVVFLPNRVAAHGDARLPRMDVGDIDAGQHLLQVLHPGDALGLESLAAEHGDRRR
ncbi:hypothetical protein RLJV_23410 [Pseudomonas aeruginosa]|nr:hypothetical protein RLJV_23410 [Pseudomonas aeruginosa]